MPVRDQHARGAVVCHPGRRQAQRAPHHLEGDHRDAEGHSDELPRSRSRAAAGASDVCRAARKRGRRLTPTAALGPARACQTAVTIDLGSFAMLAERESREFPGTRMPKKKDSGAKGVGRWAAIGMTPVNAAW